MNWKFGSAATNWVFGSTNYTPEVSEDFAVTSWPVSVTRGSSYTLPCSGVSEAPSAATLDGQPLTVSSFTEDEIQFTVPDDSYAGHGNKVLSFTVAGVTRSTTLPHNPPAGWIFVNLLSYEPGEMDALAGLIDVATEDPVVPQAGGQILNTTPTTPNLESAVYPVSFESDGSPVIGVNSALLDGTETFQVRYLLPGIGISNVGTVSTSDYVGNLTAPTLQDPVFITIAEGQTQLTGLAAAGGSDPKVYTITGGDSELFDINQSTGATSFKVAPNYESPNSSEESNEYKFVRSAENAVSVATQLVTVTVTNVIEDVTPAPFSFNTLNNADPGQVYTATAVLDEFEAGAQLTAVNLELSNDGSTWVTSLIGTPEVTQVRVTETSAGYGQQIVKSGSVNGVTATFTINTRQEDADTAPNSFTLQDQADAPAGEFAESNAVEVTGITAGVQVDVAVTNGAWRKSSNGGTTWSTWTASAGTATLSDLVQVRGTASSTAGGVVNVALTIGGVTDTFTITTAQANDTTPASFSFNPAANVAVSTIQESNAVQVLGVTDGVDVPVSVSGGFWRKSTDGGTTWTDYTQAQGTVQLDDLVQVRGSSASIEGTTVTVTLTIGGVAGSFAISTQAAADLTPGPISFAAATNAPLQTLMVSSEALITAVTAGVNIPVTVADAEWSYSTDGGTTWSAWSAAAGNVQLGHRVRLRVMSSALNGPTTQGTLTVGGVSATFSVTTVAAVGAVMPPAARVVFVGETQGFSIATGEWMSPRTVTKSQATGERLDYAFNFHNTLLRAQDAISGFELESPTGLQVSTAVLAAAGTCVVFWVEGAQAGSTYTISCRVTTTHGRVIKSTFRIVGLA